MVAVAGGAAFTFGYAEHVELLAAAGRDVAVVDPLHDEALPAGTAALVLPGGFPEEHVAALSANAPLLADRLGARRVGRCPVHAECGGLLYLCADLDGAPLAGVLPGHRRHDRPAHPRLPRRRRTAAPCRSPPGRGSPGTSSTTAR